MLRTHFDRQLRNKRQEGEIAYRVRRCNYPYLVTHKRVLLRLFINSSTFLSATAHNTAEAFDPRVSAASDIARTNVISGELTQAQCFLLCLNFISQLLG